MKKRRIPLGLLMIIIFGLVYLRTFLVFIFGDKFFEESYMFEDIRECEKICHLGLDGEEIRRYESPKKDKSLKDLKYKEFFGAKYKADGVEFEIFAYVFESADEAKQYFENETGKDYLSVNFSASNNGTVYTHAVLVNEKAYVLHTPSRYVEETGEILSDIFTTTFEEQEVKLSK